MIELLRGSEVLRICKEKKQTIGAMMLERETELQGKSKQVLLADMQQQLTTMRLAIKRGLDQPQRSLGGLVGGEAARLYSAAQTPSFSGKNMLLGAAMAMATVEVNACMGRIVAAPTAGASGILPGVLLAAQQTHGYEDDELIMALFCASAIGALIATNASISGAQGGCQAETGAAAAMAAAALVELAKGTPAQCLTAAAIALQNVMGLVCDPVAGLVEVPCVKRNAIGAANAQLSADLALCGADEVIPFDETVQAAKHVGELLPFSLKESAQGGLAVTPTGRCIRQRIFGAQQEE